VSVFVQGTLVAQGTDSVNAVVSLAAHADRRLRLSFAAANLSGGTTTAESAEFRVVSSRWTEVAKLTGPGFLLDAAPDRIVYVTGDFVNVREVATGAERTVFAESSAGSTTARLVPNGVLLSLNGGSRKPNGMREVGGSGRSTGRGYAEAVSGRWVTWVTDEGLQRFHRDDVVARRFTTTTLEGGKGPAGYDVGDDGTVVIALRPFAHLGGDLNEKTQLYRIGEAGAAEQITFDTTAHSQTPKTDGTLLAYTRQTSTPAGSRYRLMLRTPAGEAALARPDSVLSRYEVSAGWVVFTQPDDAGIIQVWARSPAGEVRRVTSWGTRSSLAGLGPAGQLVVENNGRWHFARTPGEALIDIGLVPEGQLRWFHGYDGTYLWTGSRLLRLDF
jgi:hypothetical protein